MVWGRVCPCKNTVNDIIACGGCWYFCNMCWAVLAVLIGLASNRNSSVDVFLMEQCIRNGAGLVQLQKVSKEYFVIIPVRESTQLTLLELFRPQGMARLGNIQRLVCINGLCKGRHLWHQWALCQSKSLSLCHASHRNWLCPVLCKHPAIRLGLNCHFCTACRGPNFSCKMLRPHSGYVVYAT